MTPKNTAFIVKVPTLKAEAAVLLKCWLAIYHTTQHNIPEDSNFQVCSSVRMYFHTYGFQSYITILEEPATFIFRVQ
jgi:hypothetical protein